MYPIHRILVAIKDLRAKQFPAIGKAAQLARALDAEVCLFHGITEPVYLDVVRVNGESLPELEQQGSATYCKRLESLARGLRRRGIKVTTAVEWDYPAHEAVIRAATRSNADLIVAECHRGAHLAPWLLHFTDWELLRNSAVPVLLVKNRRPYHRSKVLAAVDPTHAFAKPTNLDDEILRYGSTIADALHSLTRQSAQSLQTQRQVRPALVSSQSMYFIDDDPAQIGEERQRDRLAEQHGQAFRRGHQDLRRRLALPLALGLRGVAGARFSPDRQP